MKSQKCLVIMMLRNKEIKIILGVGLFIFCGLLIRPEKIHKIEYGSILSNNDIILNKEEKTTTISFVGDIMLDRYIRKIAESNSYDYLFRNVKDKLKESDFVIGNLEGSVTNFDSISNSDIESERFYFTFSEEVVPALEKSNINIVSIDNNHISNFGQEGIKQTIENLNKYNVSSFGDPFNRNVLYKKINGITFIFVSYNDFIRPDPEGAIKYIKKADNLVDHVVVYAHWGNEYDMEANNNQVELAKRFIEAGADLIIGAHPHVIQNIDLYNGKYIYYSLGNFIFDQYFNKDVSCGLVVKFEFTKDDIKLLEESGVKLNINDVVNWSECHINYVDK